MYGQKTMTQPTVETTLTVTRSLIQRVTLPLKVIPVLPLTFLLKAAPVVLPRNPLRKLLPLIPLKDLLPAMLLLPLTPRTPLRKLLPRNPLRNSKQLRNLRL